MLCRPAFRFSSFVLLTALLTACGGGGGGDEPVPAPASAPSTATPGAGNAAPTIQGQPAQSALVGQSYVFEPTASDSNGDSLTFSVTNLPGWASFSASTGRISGTPAAADVATAGGIIITVSDGRASASLGPFAISVAQNASGSALLSWTPPVQNTDGSTLVDLAGYRIVYGRSVTDLTQTVSITNPSLSSYLIENLSPGTWYFALMAVNSLGVTSDPSSSATKTIT